jgi:Tyosinase C-terminal domain
LLISASWLHHANVDRLFSLWQAIYPNQYLTPTTEGLGTFAIPPGNLDTQWTSLEPFTFNGRGQFYTSASSWKISTFGYTYPEIQDWNQTPAQLKSNVSAAINRMYNPQGIPAKRAATPGAQTKAWSVALNVSKYDLQGERFIVRVFLGQIPENPEDWPLSSGCAGSSPTPGQWTISDHHRVFRSRFDEGLVGEWRQSDGCCSRGEVVGEQSELGCAEGKLSPQLILELTDL